MEKVCYEEIFFLIYRGGFSLIEAYNLPVLLRKWFAERIIKEMKLDIAAMNGKQVDPDSI